MSDVKSVTKAEATTMSNTEKPRSSDEDGLPPDVAALMQEFSGAKYNKLMRKLDMRLIPIVSSPNYVWKFEMTVVLTRLFSSDCCVISPCIPGPVRQSN